ncbi:putative carboxypeptidase [Triangularia verruculosa]|uniref:Carboxypeptidase n=1 Tax=Triangularia verruculosa TaxID=2587418 RepID=A0AAN6XN30_9PEZI|nr:putative carboxypeptidase [Triangularia verruculosa]
MSIFFWYFQARKSPNSAPTSIYISGGPGSSAFDETNGFPCSFNSDGNSTRLNTHSWNEDVNMLYIDQPVGAGFSYSKIVNGVADLMDSLSEDESFFTPGTVGELHDKTNLTVAPATIQSLDPRDGVNTTQQAARVMWWFSQVWFQEFPGYETTNKDISLWTVSFGGFYGPAFLAHFHRQSAALPSSDQPTSIPLKLSTLGVQNGCMDVLTMGMSYLDFSVNNTYGVKAYPDEVYAAAKTNLTEICQPLLLACRAAVAEGDSMGYGNNATVNQACALAAGVCFGFVQGAFTSYSQLNPFDIGLSHPETYPALHWVEYLNQDWVQAGLGVPVNFTSVSRVSGAVFFALTGDPMRHDLSDLAYLLGNGIKVAMVYGDLDYRCNWFGAEEISLAVGGERFKEAGYADVKVGERVGGVVREVEGLSFVRVFDAGHSVYTYQPEVVNEVFRRVMKGRDVATGEREVDGGYMTEGPGDVRGLTVKASEGRDAGCFLVDVGRTCDQGQIEALRGGTARVVNGMVVEPAREGKGSGDQDVGNGNGKGGGDASGPGANEQEQVKSAGTGKSAAAMATAVIPMGLMTLALFYCACVGFLTHRPQIREAQSLPRTSPTSFGLVITSEDAFTMSPAPRASRSRRGCITCRIRRVKCDETRPQCTRCAKAGRTCDGYAATSSQLSGRELATAVKTLQVVGPAARVLGEAVLTEDSACFDFFRMCTVAMTSTAFPAPFWSRHVLQVAHSEPAVWKAAVAIGALHRRWESRSKRRVRPNPVRSPGLDTSEEFTKQAMQQYWSAISMARTIQDPAVLMVMSVILAAAANMAGEWAASHVHIQSGLKLVASQVGDGDKEMSSEIASIAQSLSRLDLLVMTFEDSRAPYAYVDPTTGKIPSSILNMPRVGKMDDLMQASMHLFGMFRYFLSVEGGYIMDFVAEEDLPGLQVRITEDIATWRAEFEILAGTVYPLASSNVAERTTLLSLELYHSVLCLMSQAGISGPAVRWDAYTDEFARIITLCETINKNMFSPLPFFMSLEPGLVMPLFLTITRCRHPLIRRRGLRLLKSLNRQEGMWNSPAACVVAEQKVLAEEEHLPFPLPLYIENLDNMPMDGPAGKGWERSMAPEELRVTRDKLEVDVETGRIDLTLYTGLGKEERAIKTLSLGY